MEIGTVRRVDINAEMRGSYLDYAMSVIVARALPDVRDGLKPVQRRILYAMHDMGLRPDRPYKKSARIVGEVLGKYHPHGDAAVYDAMVRLAQDFSMRYPLVDGQGNFGSVDGDSAAAMRYTEARLAEIAEEMLTDIEKETVDFVDNFDGTLKEPALLPSNLPNLLLSGSSGIAVGMSTNIPPHNLSEICDALIFMIESAERGDEVSVEDLMRFVQGPDFPTGGIIYRYGSEGDGEVVDRVKKAYATGRGRIIMQAKTHVEEMTRSRHRIVITELPYQINKSNLIERIAELARENRIEGIADLRDESDRQGMRIVIELTRTVQPTEVLAQLYRYTPMQSTFGLIMLALMDGEPRLLPLKRVLQLYLEHRQEIITRRSRHDLARAKHRTHVLEGLRIALDNLDKIIATIRRSRSVESARRNLRRKFRLTEVQAQAILDMQLRRLAALERKKIEEEYKETVKLIAHLEDLLAHPRKVLLLIRDDLKELKNKYGDRRRTQIVERERIALAAEDLIPDMEALIIVNRRGYIRRLLPRKGRRFPKKGIAHLLVANNRRDELLFLTEKGQGFRLKTHQVPEMVGSRKGVPLGSLINVEDGQKVVTALTLPGAALEEGGKWYLITTTRRGKVKRSTLEELMASRASGTTVMKIDRGDELFSATLSSGDQEIVLVTRQGQAIRFAEEEIRPMGLMTGGVMGVKLADDDAVVGMGLVRQGAELLVVTEKGYGKRTPLADYPVQGRYGGGVRTAKLSERTGFLVSAQIVGEKEAVILVSAKRAAANIQVKHVPRLGRQTQGAVIMELRKGDSVAAILCRP
ncbi:MAG: DNA gyrase subunit A [Anaerolineae bacterium]